MMQYNKSSAFDSMEPVTANQLNYLKILNYNGNPPKTKGEAYDLISKLKAIPVPSLAIYSDHWSEKNIFEHFREHKKEYYAAKEWRDSLDN